MNKIYLIAEIGINHNGSLSLAKKLIDNAKYAGFDAVKFQKRDIDLVYTKSFLESFRESPWGKTQGEQKKGLEFGKKEYDEINRYCKKIKIDWFASAWDIKSLKFLHQYKNKYNKIASAMIVDLNFLEAVAKKRKYTFISTGMSTLNQISKAVSIFKKYKCKFELMHCVSTYPMKVEDANLSTIEDLRKKYKCNVGYSGHETGLGVSFAAAMLNVSSIERHITLDRSKYGSDQAASLETNGMNQLVKIIKTMQKAIGKPRLGYVLPEEKKIAKKIREHIKYLPKTSSS